MDENVFQFCKYWKGETEPPAKYEDGDAFHFWRMEMQYFTQIYPNNRERWEVESLGILLENYPEFKPIIDGLPLEARGMFAYSVEYLFYMSPYADPKFFLNYGK